ncbi:MAG: PIN domain-containing protein [Deltaproteobacteria bacterium]|nr:PIN domain-containing protein [Deltaproteobacteria bacterium]
MTKILVDTCVWIEFFSKKSYLPEKEMNQLSEWIKEQLVSTIEPIRAELLSGLMADNTDCRFCLDALEYRDLPWRDRETWDQLIDIAKFANKRKLKTTGLIDRMILLSAIESGDQLWSLDRALIQLAKHLGIQVYL